MRSRSRSRPGEKACGQRDQEAPQEDAQAQAAQAPEATTPQEVALREVAPRRAGPARSRVRAIGLSCPALVSRARDTHRALPGARRTAPAAGCRRPNGVVGELQAADAACRRASESPRAHSPQDESIHPTARRSDPAPRRRGALPRGLAPASSAAARPSAALRPCRTRSPPGGSGSERSRTTPLPSSRASPRALRSGSITRSDSLEKCCVDRNLHSHPHVFFDDLP